MNKKTETAVFVPDPDLKKVVEEGLEIDLYFLIEECGGFIWRMNHDMCDGRIPEKDWPAIDESIRKIQKTMEYAVPNVTRFGVTMLPDNRPSPEYWAWYKHWKNYITGLSQEEWHKLEGIIAEKGDYSSYHPAEKWNANFQEVDDIIK